MAQVKQREEVHMFAYRMSRWIILVALLVGWSCLAPSSPVRAATCSGTGCNNQDPYAMGCAGAGASWRVIDMRYIYHYATGANIGYTQLWWSDTCRTNWSRVVSTSGSKYLKAYMYNNSGEFGAIFGYGTAVVGRMQYGYNIPWGACGVINDVQYSGGSGGCTPMR